MKLSIFDQLANWVIFDGFKHNVVDLSKNNEGQKVRYNVQHGLLSQHDKTVGQLDSKKHCELEEAN